MALVLANQTYNCIGHVVVTRRSLDENGKWIIHTTELGSKCIKFAIKIYQGSGRESAYFPCAAYEKQGKWFYNNVKPGDFVALLGAWHHVRKMFGSRIKDFFEIHVGDIKVLNSNTVEKIKPNEKIPWDSE